jgi:hypothetical protein
MSLLPHWFPPKFKVDPDLAEAFEQSQRAWSKPDPHSKDHRSARRLTTNQPQQRGDGTDCTCNGEDCADPDCACPCHKDYWQFGADPDSEETRYSEDQPRDDNGRFASGSDSITPSLGSLHPLTADKGSGLAPGATATEKAAQSATKLDDMHVDLLQSVHSDVTLGSMSISGQGELLKEFVAERIADRMGSQWDDKHVQSGYVVLHPKTQDMVLRAGQPLHANDILNAEFLFMRTDAGAVTVSPMHRDDLTSYEQKTLDEVNAKGVITEADHHKADLSADDTMTGASAFSQYADRTSQHDQDRPDYARGDTPQAAQMMREAAVAGLVHQWAMTSNDTDYKSLAMQESAVTEFGLTKTSDWVRADEVPRGVSKEVEQNGDYYRAFLRAQYDETQQQLKDAGITELHLFRGKDAQTDRESAVARGHGTGEETTALRPMSSWTTDLGTAQSFSGGGSLEPVVLTATVPADRVLSTPSSGFGCFNENEVVVLGGTDHVGIRSRR